MWEHKCQLTVIGHQVVFNLPAPNYKVQLSPCENRADNCAVNSKRASEYTLPSARSAQAASFPKPNRTIPGARTWADADYFLLSKRDAADNIWCPILILMSYLDSPDIDWIDAQVHTQTLDYASIACVFAYVSLYLTLTLSWKTLKNNDPLFVLYVLLLLACMLKNICKSSSLRRSPVLSWKAAIKTRSSSMSAPSSHTLCIVLWSMHGCLGQYLHRLWCISNTAFCSNSCPSTTAIHRAH